MNASTHAQNNAHPVYQRREKPEFCETVCTFQSFSPSIKICMQTNLHNFKLCILVTLKLIVLYKTEKAFEKTRKPMLRSTQIMCKRNS